MPIASETVREAVAVFDRPAHLQAAIDELLSSGFRRAELSLLAGEQAVLEKLGRHGSIASLADNPDAPRTDYVSPEAIGNVRHPPSCDKSRPAPSPYLGREGQGRGVGGVFRVQGSATRVRRVEAKQRHVGSALGTSTAQAIHAASAPANCPATKPGASRGRTPANVSLIERATVIAGLAKDVLAVHQ